MAQLTLPKNSTIDKKAGKAFKTPGAKKPRSFKIYRYDPDSGANPRVDTYEGITVDFELAEQQDGTFEVTRAADADSEVALDDPTAIHPQ